MAATARRRRVLIGYDGSEGASDALALGSLLGKTIGRELVLACVYAHEPILSKEIQQARQDDAEAKLDSALAELGSIELPVHGLAHPSTSAARGLCELAEDAELVVIGAHRHPSPSRLLPVRVAARLLHGSPCPVAIAPRGFASRRPGRLRRIVVGFDGSPESRLAVAEAATLAASGGIELLVVRAVPDARPELIRALPPEALAGYLTTQAERAEVDVDEIVRELQQTAPCRGEVLRGDPARSLAAAAAGEKADLLIVGSRGYGPFRRVLLGSVSGHLARSTDAPLLVTPRGAQVTADQPARAAGAACSVATQSSIRAHQA